VYLLRDGVARPSSVAPGRLLSVDSRAEQAMLAHLVRQPAVRSHVREHAKRPMGLRIGAERPQKSATSFPQSAGWRPVGS